MTIYKTTELEQIWKHSSGQVISLNAIAPIDEEDETAEYTYGSQGSIMGSESELVASGWTKIDESEYIGIKKSRINAILSLEPAYDRLVSIEESEE